MDERDFDMRSLVSLLRRRLRLILTSLAICLGLAGVTVLVLKPVYSASALILVDPTRSGLVDSDAQAARPVDGARVDSEVEILRSDAVLYEVIAEQDLLNDPEFGVRLGLGEQVMAILGWGTAEMAEGETATRSVLSRFKNAVSVQRRGVTHIIAVQVRSEDAQKAANLANAVAEAYVESQMRAKVGNIIAASEVLEIRLALARQNILQAEEAFDAFTGNLDQLTASPGGSIVSLGEGLDPATGMDSEGLNLVSPISPELREDILLTDEALEQRMEEVIFEPRIQVADLDDRADGIRLWMQSALMSGDLSVQGRAELYELQQTAEMMRRQYQSLLARSGELRMQSELQIADSRIVSRALTPSAASFPNAGLILFIAGLGGIGLGVGLAFIQENFVGGITSESQLGLITRLPVVGSVPFERLKGDAASPADIMVTAPLSRYGESIRQVRAGVDQHVRRARMAGGSRAGGQVIMVSSALPGEGKSSLALSLARAYAQSGKKTLIIDCDLRNPAIHKHLGMEPTVGLFDFLAGRAHEEALAAIVLQDDHSGLNLLVGSHRSDIPTDQLITGAPFGRLIAAAVSGFDVVILDTPPVLPVVDGLYLSQYADAVLMVVRWSATDQAELRDAIGRLDQARNAEAPLLMMLSQQVPERSRYGKSYDGYYMV